MALVRGHYLESASWEDLVSVASKQPASLAESFSMALAAITEARGQGHLTDQEADVLVREVVAVMVGVELNNVILSTFARQTKGIMPARGFYPHHTWSLFAPTLL